MTIKVGAGPGGGFDLSARLVARYLDRFLPGNPAIVVQNVPGGGGLRLATLMTGAEPNDGSVIASNNFSNALAPVLEPENASFDPLALQWIGALSRDQHFCIVMKDTGIETLEQFLEGSFALGATSRGSATHMLAALVKNGLDARFSIVTGFQGIADIGLAMQRGEIAGYCGISHSSFMTSGLVESVNVIGYFGALEVDGYTGLPRFSALIEDPFKREAAEFIETPLDFHFSFAAPEGTAPDILATLRDAFDRMAADPEFIAEAESTNNLVVRFTPGAEMEAAFTARLSADPAMFEAARALLQ